MDTAEGMAQLIAQGKEQYLHLLDEATDLLRNLDVSSPEAMAETLQVRQNILELLQIFDQRLNRALSGGGDALAEFRAFQESTTKRILEIDGLVIALARDKQAAIKGKLASLKESKAASEAYEGTSSTGRCWFTDTA